MSTGERGEAAGLLEYIDASPSPFHACREAARRLVDAGFTELTETDPWPDGPGCWYVVRGGSLVAWSVPEGAPPHMGFRIVGAHTDSPNLRIKPRPDVTRAGFRQLAVEVYGGPLLNSWLDRDLGLSGRVVVAGEHGTETRLLKVDRPLLRIPQLAIHLDRDISTSGLQLNPQQHLVPVWGLSRTDTTGFVQFLAGELGTAADAVLAWDVMAHDLAPGVLAGSDEEFVSSARLDNLCSSYCGLRALLDAAPTAATVPVLCLFDHEEVGSTSDRGAGSTILPTILERSVLARGGDRDAFLRALAASLCVSADMAHATHPNYADRHEPGHWIEINAGPVIKTNVNQRYATDAVGAAAFGAACAAAGVPLQRYAHRTDLPCGSTIGPITASRLGVPTVDVGLAQLAMHSVRELAGSHDPELMVRALTAFASMEGSPRA